MLLSFVLNVPCIVALVSCSYALGVPISLGNITGSNPLPPAPPTPPVGPDNYPISSSNLTLHVERPYGEDLPFYPTILCLISAQSDLSRQVARRGDVIIGDSYTFEENGIKVYVQAVYIRIFFLSKASNALRGMNELMIGYPELGTKAVSAALLEEGEGVIGRVVISRSGAGADEQAIINFNGTTSLSALGNLTAFDPQNYRVPGTTTTVALEGARPYGSPLPKDLLVLALVSAQTAADETIRNIGDIALPGLWRFEEGVIRIDVFTHLSVDCKFSTLENGLMGLVDLINEPGGVGAVAADFIFKEDGKGEVAAGRLRLIGPSDSAATMVDMASATLIESSNTVSVTVVGGPVETGVVDTA